MEHFAGTKQLFASGKASARRDSQFSTHCQGDAHTRMGQRRHFPEKQTCLTTVYAAHVPLGFLFLNDRNRETTPSYSKEKRKQHCPGTVGTSSRAVACAFGSQPQLLLCASVHAVARPQNNSSSTVEMTSSTTICS